VTFGAEIFLDAYVIQNLNSLTDFLSEHENKPKNGKEIWHFLEPFAWNRMIDDVRILSCFENVLKAELIDKGFLVHELEEKKKTQKKQPIKFQELSDREKLMLKDFTLQISTILGRESYSTLLSIPHAFKVELKRIAVDRNRLHLIDSLNISYSLERVVLLQEMKTYIQGMIEKIKKHST